MSSEFKNKLSDQVCFPVYAASRIIIRHYKPELDKLGLTYPQYLVMLLLWEYKTLIVSDVCDKLYLETNTLTPIIQKLEKKGFIARKKSEVDSRKKVISLTKKGKAIQEPAIKR